MKKLDSSKKLPGQLLIELLLAMAIFALLIPAVISGLVSSNQSDTLNQRRIEATAIANEAYETIRVVRQNAWANVATAGTYHPQLTGATWTLQPNAITLDGYTRSTVISNVSRDAAGLIVTTGGTLDPSTKKVVTTISWTSPISDSVRQEYYLTRYLDNMIQTDSTAVQFNQGVLTGVAVTTTSDGEVTLGASGKGDWCNPNLNIQAIDLPKSGVANAISAIQGQIVAGTGENASGIAFAKIGVSSGDPPTGTIQGTFDGYKTNGVFTEQRYAYLATDTNSKEVVIIDMNQYNAATGKYAEVGYFNISGSHDGLSVTTAGNIGFVTADDNKIYAFNLTAKTGSRALLSSLTLTGTGTKVVVNGNDLFISIAGATEELQVVRFNAAGTTLTKYGYADINGAAAYDVAVNSTGTRAYIATTNSGSQPEFFIINTTNKTSSNPRFANSGTYDSNGMSATGVAVVPGNKAILVGRNGEEYQVINIADEAHPVRCGGLQINTGVFGIASVLESDNDAYSYIVTGDNLLELKIIKGGPGGQFSNEGTFVSRIFTAGYSSLFNYFDWVTQVVANTAIQYQVAIADQVSGNCTTANYVYVGPDKTASSFFTGPSVLPFDDDGAGYENPGQCFRYKLLLTSTDSFASPIFSQMTFNYSP